MPTCAATKLDLRPVSRLFKALADETRLRIVALLAHGELCVCHVQDALDLAQPSASRQLGILKAAGVVDSRRQGTWTYFKLAPQLDDQRRRQLRALVRSFAGQAVLKQDVERLLRARGPGRCL